MRNILILFLCFIPIIVNGQTSGLFIDTVSDYNSWGWKSVTMGNDLITFAVTPAIGGRVMQYDLGSHSSIFINTTEFGKTYTPVQYGPWHNFGGYKTWPSPQSRWPNTWPPPPTLDYGNYTFQVDSLSEDSVSVLVVSPIEQWIATGIQFERKATAYPATTRIKMEQTIINRGIQSAIWGMWSITQSIVKHPGQTDYENFWAYFPLNPNSVYGSSGVKMPEGSSSAWKGEIRPGIYGVQFVPDNKKIFGDTHKGWIAYTDLLDSVVYARTFEVFEGAHYPDSARVTVYVSASNPVYMEVEVKAPLVSLDSDSGRYVFTENWWAAKVRAPVLDVNSVGVIASRLNYTSPAQNLSAVYGIFYEGTARTVFVDRMDQVLMQGPSHVVSPLEEFRLEETVSIPDSASMLRVLVYNANDELIGVLDSVDVSQLTTGIGEYNAPDRPTYLNARNYPNPFNPVTTIMYELPERSSVNVKIFNIQGCEVKSFDYNMQFAGDQKIFWDGTDAKGCLLASGIYICRIIAESLEDGKIFDQSAKMIFLK